MCKNEYILLPILGLVIEEEEKEVEEEEEEEEDRESQQISGSYSSCVFYVTEYYHV